MNTEEISKAVAAIRAKIEAKMRGGRGKTEEVLPPMLPLPSLKPTIWSLTDEIGPKDWVEKERKVWATWQQMIIKHPHILTQPEMVGPNETIKIYPRYLHNPKVVVAIREAHSPQEAYDMIHRYVSKDAADEFAELYIRMRREKRLASYPPETPENEIIADELTDLLIRSHPKSSRRTPLGVLPTRKMANEEWLAKDEEWWAKHVGGISRSTE